MSVCIHYWAIPPQSTLYARLQEDRVFNVLMASFFTHDCGIYTFADLDPKEVEKVQEHITERNRAALGPKREARGRIGEFLAEVERTRIGFPGIERRTAMLEKCGPEIEEHLTDALRTGRADAAELTQKLIFGDKLLAPHLRKKGEDILGLVSQSLVREGATILQRLKPEALFPSEEDWAEWCRDNYSDLREAYLAAAGHGEEILVGVSA